MVARFMLLWYYISNRGYIYGMCQYKLFAQKHFSEHECQITFIIVRISHQYRIYDVKRIYHHSFKIINPKFATIEEVMSALHTTTDLVDKPEAPKLIILN